MLRLFKSLLCASMVVVGRSATLPQPIEKLFSQGPQNHYLMNSSTLFLPTDYITMTSPVSDARSVVLTSGMVGGLDSYNAAGVESRAFRDSNDGDFFYQMWHLAHIDDKHHRTNVVTIIISLGNIGVSPSGDIEDTNRMLDTDPTPKVYVQVYRAWSVPVTVPLTQTNIDGWWHSITHAFHTVMHIWHEVQPWIGVARTVYPILVSLDDTQSGLGLKSIKYSPEPQAITDTSASTTGTSTDQPFTYSITPGEMSAIVIFVYLSGLITFAVIVKLFKFKLSDKRHVQRIDTHSSTTAPFI